MIFHVSIIIPTHNRSSILGETLDSVLNQSYPNWECLVIDDGSTDYTRQLIEFYCKKEKRISYFSRPKKKRKGGNSCRNFGLELALGSYVIFLDSDDILAKTCLERRLNLVRQFSHLDFYVFQSQLFISSLNDLEIVPNLLNKELDDISRFICKDYPWNISAAIINREFLKRVKIQWDESLSIHQDLDFYLKILAKKPSYKKEDGFPDVFIRMGNNDKLTQNLSQRKESIGKFHFCKNVLKILKTNIAEMPELRWRIYSMMISTSMILIQQREFSLVARLSYVYLSEGFFSQSLTLIPDTIYLHLKRSYIRPIIQKSLSIYKFTGVTRRAKFFPMKSSTLAKYSVSEYIQKTAALTTSEK